MTPGELRRGVDDLLAFFERYRASIDERPVWPTGLEPGQIRDMLPERAPETPQPWSEILEDATGDDGPVQRGTTHWQHPRFFAFFPATATDPALLGDMLSSMLGTQGMLWRTGPACTEVESRVLDWFVHLLGLPEHFLADSDGSSWTGGGGGGVIQGTASEATLCSIVAARARSVRTAREAGDDSAYAELASRCCLYASSQAHSSVVKAAMIAGLAEHPEDRSRVRLVDVDPDTLAMDAAALEAAIRADLDAGLIPCWIGATMGTTSSGAFDPIDEIGAVARAHRVWLHVDAAWAGAALVCPELRDGARAGGLVHADSFCFNPHKWLLTTFDLDALFVSDRRSLLDGLSIMPEYLRTPESEGGAAIDYRDWQIPLGRRFRALKLWFVVRWYGAEGLRAHIRRGIALAERAEARVRADERFELTTERSLSLICFRVRHDDPERRDELTAALCDRVNATGRTLLTRTTLPGRWGGGVVIRFSVGGIATEAVHVDETWDLIGSVADETLGSGRGG